MLGGQAVAEAEVGVDEPPPRKRLCELHPQLAHVDVDRPIPGTHLPPPDEGEQLLPRHDPISPPCQLGEQAQLADREHQCPARRPREVLLREDLERSYGECFTTRFGGCRHESRWSPRAATPALPSRDRRVKKLLPER